MPTVFEQKAPWIMQLLIEDFLFSTEDAAAIVGNAGHESGGLVKLQEMRPVVPGSRGGWGWFQWTGPRRVAFESYCKRNNLDPKGDKANYGWLWNELKGPEKNAIAKTKSAQGLFNKVVAFEQGFERAGVKHYPSRYAWAKKALDYYLKAPKPIKCPEWARPTVKIPVDGIEERKEDMLTGEKTQTESKTVWGGWAAIAAGIALVLNVIFGYEVNQEMQDKIVELAAAAVAVAGGALAWYGRLKATKKIT